jgi:hypothetical protein
MDAKSWFVLTVDAFCLLAFCVLYARVLMGLPIF